MRFLEVPVGIVMTKKSIVTVGTILAEFSPVNNGESLKTAQSYRLIAGGAITNTAFSLSYLETDVKLVSAVSNDSLGQFLLNEFHKNHLDTTYIKVVADMPTSLSLSAVDLLGGKEFIFYRSPLLDEITKKDFPTDFKDGYIFDFSEGAIRSASVREEVFAAAKIAKENGATICYAVNLREKSWGLNKNEIAKIEREAIALSDIVILNNEELNYITGLTGENAINSLHELFPSVVLVTSGGDDCTLLSVNSEIKSVPIYKVEVKYDVGAGDTFHAGILAHMSKNELKTAEDWGDCVKFANAVAAYRISTSEAPSCLKSTENILNWMKEREK